jgi:BirA family transcriptional regulator, biotin operon repressor / biotin---[acetyl-CoA-carboxylase] ligase
MVGWMAGRAGPMEEEGLGGSRAVDGEAVAAAARAAGLSGLARHVAVTGSTNDDLMAAADAGAPAWSVMAAGLQEAGRGRLGRTWVAPQGSSLLVSVLLRPSLPPEVAPIVAFGATTALSEALDEAGVQTRCRWPNDVVSASSGRKIAGVLPESRIEGGVLRHVVVGTGVNVLQSASDFPEELRDTATSVAIEGGALDQARLLASYLAAFRGRYDPDEPGFVMRTLDAYRPRCETIGQDVRATTVDGEIVEGRAVGLSVTGGLVVRPPGREVEIAFGEIERLR